MNARGLHGVWAAVLRLQPDASEWHYDEFSGEMRRRIEGHWEYRKPTADEEESHAQARAW